MIERIGNCRIVDEIGSGGMAVIYKAVQESLSRTVAIKALKTSVAQDQQFAIRFEREAKSMAALTHENILHVYDFQKLGGSLFIVMEYVEGIDLYDLLEKAPLLPVDVAAIITMQIARALDYAHYRGVIHRDVKPANIMVAKSGGVKLMDFGIARDPSFGDLTERGTGLGTPSYMSPEQILGERLDFRSDMFSLGVVLFQMVCGRKPFIEDDDHTVLHKIRVEKHPNPRKLNPEVPRELERIVSKCLAKKKEDRYRSTQDLVIALERFVASRCEMNYHARIVQFLRELGVVTEEEARRYLVSAGAGFLQKVRAAQPAQAGIDLKRLLALEGVLLGLMALGASFIHLSPIGVRPPPAIAAPPPKPIVRGKVRVIVEPWAEVWVDGKKVETTPIARPIEMEVGKRKVELKNPYFAPVEREIVVAKDGVQTLRASLVQK